MTQRRAPDENSSRHSQSSSVHFGNSPFGLRHPKCLTLGLNRLPKFSNGTALKAFPNPARPWSGPTPCTRRLRTRKRWVQAKLLGTRLGQRERPDRANAHCLRHPHPNPLPEGEGLVDKDNSMGSKISFRLRRGYAKKSIKGEKLPTQNPEDPYFF